MNSIKSIKFGGVNLCIDGDISKIEGKDQKVSFSLCDKPALSIRHSKIFMLIIFFVFSYLSWIFTSSYVHLFILLSSGIFGLFMFLKILLSTIYNENDRDFIDIDAGSDILAASLPSSQITLENWTVSFVKRYRLNHDDETTLGYGTHFIPAVVIQSLVLPDRSLVIYSANKKTLNAVYDALNWVTLAGQSGPTSI